VRLVLIGADGAAMLTGFGKATVGGAQAVCVCGRVAGSLEYTDLPASQVVAERPAAVGLVAQPDFPPGAHRPARRGHRDGLQRGLAWVMSEA